MTRLAPMSVVPPSFRRVGEEPMFSRQALQSVYTALLDFDAGGRQEGPSNLRRENLLRSGGRDNPRRLVDSEALDCAPDQIHLADVHPGADHWVGITFWDVGEVYRHPCQWKGKRMIQPGPTVAGLAKVLANRPLRDAAGASLYEHGSTPAPSRSETIRAGSHPMPS
jgi:hypothetical protein